MKEPEYDFSDYTEEELLDIIESIIKDVEHIPSGFIFPSVESHKIFDEAMKAWTKEQMDEAHKKSEPLHTIWAGVCRIIERFRSRL